MQRFKSLVKKARSLIKAGMKPYEVGKHYFENPDCEVEIEAKRRATLCDCAVDEPIEWLRVEDKRMPELSGKICKECGCTLSYKVRQSIEICDKWQREQNT